MKKIDIQINTKPEKVVTAATLSAIGAILFHKKGKSFFKSVNKNYKIIDRALSMTVAKDIAQKEKAKAEEELKTKLKDMHIEEAEFIDI